MSQGCSLAQSPKTAIYESHEQLCTYTVHLGKKTPNINDNHIPVVLKLFASFVHSDLLGQKFTIWQQDGDVFSLISKKYIEVVSTCCANIVYWLLRRIVCHTFDNQTESLDKNTVALFLYKGEADFHLLSLSPALLQNDVYQGDTEITKDELLVCCVDCKSGEKNTDVKEKIRTTQLTR